MWIGGIVTVGWDKVIELPQVFLKVRRHWQVDLFVVIVPIQLNFYEFFFAFEIDSIIVVVFERSDEVVQVIFVDIFDPKAVNHQEKLDCFGFVLPESWHSLALEISLFVQSLFK